MRRTAAERAVDGGRAPGPGARLLGGRRHRKDVAGPFDYCTTFEVPEVGPGERVWLRFGAVSYACTVFVDDLEVGRHVGMWDAFDVEITVGRRRRA